MLSPFLKILVVGVSFAAIGTILNACGSGDSDVARPTVAATKATGASPTIVATAALESTRPAPTRMPANSPEPAVTTVPAVPTVPPTDSAVIFESSWTGTAEEGPASGGMRIVSSAEGGYTLEFSDVSITSGPALHVYLTPASDGRSVDGALDLGALHATSGSFTYAIPPGTDLALYRSAIVWCQEFSVLFAVAPLTPR